MNAENARYGHDGRRLRDHAARGAAWSLIAQWSMRLSGLVTFVILARLLAPEDFGAIALASALVLALSWLADFGFSAYLVQADDPDQRLFSTAFWFSLAGGLVLAVGLALAAWPISEVVRAPEAAPVIAAVSLSVFVDSLTNVPTALLRRRFQFKTLAVQALAATASGQAVAVALAFSGAGVWALVGQVWTLGVVGLLIVWRSARWRPSLEFSPVLARKIAGFGIHVIGASIVDQASMWISNGLISRYLGLQQLGYVAMANRIVVMAVETVNHAAYQFGTPLLASVKDQPERLRRAWAAGQTIVTAAIVPTLGALAINADLLIPTVLGEKWAPAVPVFQLLAIGGIGRVVGWTVNRPLLLAIGRPELSMYPTVAASLLVVVATFLAAQVSITAVAAVNAAVYVTFVPIKLVIVTRTLRLPVARTSWEVLRPAGIAVLAGIPAYVVTLVFRGDVPDLLLAMASIGLFAVIHAALLRLLAPSVWSNMMGMVETIIRRRRSGDESLQER